MNILKGTSQDEATLLGLAILESNRQHFGWDMRFAVHGAKRVLDGPMYFPFIAEMDPRNPITELQAAVLSLSAQRDDRTRLIQTLASDGVAIVWEFWSWAEHISQAQAFLRSKTNPLAPQGASRSRAVMYVGRDGGFHGFLRREVRDESADPETISAEFFMEQYRTLAALNQSIHREDTK